MNTRKQASAPVHPITFQPRDPPKRAAISPAACGGLRRDQRPSRNSATSSGTAIIRQASRNTNTNAEPPLLPARYGNRHMLPSPTAAPTVTK